MAKRIGIMRPTPYTERLFNNLPKPVLVQPKLEGDRLRCLPYGTNLRTSGDKERVSVPLIKRAMKELNLPFETDGELYLHGLRHSDIRSIVGRSKHLHPNHWKMQYHIYDIITEEDQATRLMRLATITSDDHLLIKKVPSFVVYNITELQARYDMFLEEGYEGIIIRHSNRPYKRNQVPWMLKLKPRLSGEFVIIDVLPLVRKDGTVEEDLMGSFVLLTGDRQAFNVGTGPTLSDRKLFMKHDMNGVKCKIRFQGYTKANNIPKMQSIDKEWLREIRSVLR